MNSPGVFPGWADVLADTPHAGSDALEQTVRGADRPAGA